MRLKTVGASVRSNCISLNWNSSTCVLFGIFLHFNLSIIPPSPQTSSHYVSPNRLKLYVNFTNFIDRLQTSWMGQDLFVNAISVYSRFCCPSYLVIGGCSYYAELLFLLFCYYYFSNTFLNLFSTHYEIWVLKPYHVPYIYEVWYYYTTVLHILLVLLPYHISQILFT